MARHFEKGKRVWRDRPEAHWLYRFMISGQKFSGSTGTPVKREAERVAERLFKEARVTVALATKRATTSRRPESGANLTFAEACDLYMRQWGSENANAAEDENHLLRLCEPGWIGADTILTDITTSALREITAKRKAMLRLDGRGNPKVGRDGGPVLLTSATVNRSTVDLIKRVLFHVAEDHPIPHINWRKVRLPEQDKPVVTMSYDDEAKLEPYLREGYGAAFQFAMLTGVRLENFTEALTWRNVDFENRKLTITVKGAKHTRKLHTIHMDSEIEALLRAQVGHDAVHVFTYVADRTVLNPKSGRRIEKGKRYPVRYWGFVAWWKRTLKRAGVPYVSPHTLRKTAISRVVRHSKDLQAAQTLAGHSDIATTARYYAQFMEDDAVEAQELTRLAGAERRSALRNRA